MYFLTSTPIAIKLLDRQTSFFSTTERSLKVDSPLSTENLIPLTLMRDFLRVNLLAVTLNSYVFVLNLHLFYISGKALYVILKIILVYVTVPYIHCWVAGVQNPYPNFTH